MSATTKNKKDREYVHRAIADAEKDLAMLEYMDKAYMAKQIRALKNNTPKSVATSHQWSGNYSRMNMYDALAQETEGKIIHVNAYEYTPVKNNN